LEALMNGRALAVTAALAIASAVASLVSTATTAAGPNVGAQIGGWSPPRTSDGQPDLQGYWTNDTFTPLERPRELAGKEVFTEQEAAAYLKTRLDEFLAQPKDDVHYDDAIWQGETYVKQPNRRTSLIVDPSDGRIPPLTLEGRQRQAARAEARRSSGAADSAQQRSLAERCISWGNVGPPMLPPSYNANLQILQTRDYVIIRHEMIHEDRVIPLDGRPHLAAAIRLLAGDSRGRWEGHTLIVDTTNFTDKTNFRGAPRNTRQDIFAGEALHVVERFTRVDADTILYQFTVEDPETWIRPWSGEMPMRRFDGPMFEYACHEGNYGLPNILLGARFEEKQRTAEGR
jgi:hypothetical protein